MGPDKELDPRNDRRVAGRGTQQQDTSARRRRLGRRPGAKSTRTQILDAACSRFAEVGYESTTIREVARRAGVDPALVMHYFKNKEGLFDAVADTLAILPDELGKMTSGRQFVTTYFGLWEDPVTGPRLRALVRAGIGSEHATNRLREFMMQQLSSVGRDDMIHTGNFALVGSSLMGIAIARYLVEMPRFEGMTTEELVDNIAPAVDALLGQAAPKA